MLPAGMTMELPAIRAATKLTWSVTLPVKTTPNSESPIGFAGVLKVCACHRYTLFVFGYTEMYLSGATKTSFVTQSVCHAAGSIGNHGVQA